MSSWGRLARPGALPTLIRSGAGRGQVEQGGHRQPVVDDDVGPGQDLGAPHGDQAGVSGAGPRRGRRSWP